MEKIYICGYDSPHPPGFIYQEDKGHVYFLLVMTRTPARFWQGSDSYDLSAHQAVLYTPDSEIRYGAADVDYKDDWLFFTSDESYVTQFPVINTPFPVSSPDYCHSLFQLLTWERAQTNYETVISHLMSILFYRLWSDSRSSDSTEYSRDLSALRRSILQRPQNSWTVDGMADRLHISSGYLQILYKKQFGMSCMEDVIANRMHMAKDYLAHTSLHIQDVSRLCGYNSTEHFNRQFRKFFGMSPGEYRKTAFVSRTDTEENRNRH